METTSKHSHPGAAIKLLYLDQGRYSLDSLVESTGISLDKMNQILAGDAEVNESLSEKLSNAFDMANKTFWSRLQQRHDAEQSGMLGPFMRKTALVAFKDRENAVLAAMTAGVEHTDNDGELDRTYTRIQCMKLMYFIDREMGEIAGVKFFDFQPLKFGAFDKEVYNSIESLVDLGFIKKIGEGSRSYFELTLEGLKKGREILARITSEFREYFKETAYWIKSEDFETIVQTSYSMYPEMKTDAGDFKGIDLNLEEECDLIVNRILHRRRQLFDNFGYSDDSEN